LRKKSKIDGVARVDAGTSLGPVDRGAPPGMPVGGARRGRRRKPGHPLERPVWNRARGAVAGCLAAWVLHRLLGGQHTLGVWVTALIALATWLTAAGLLLLDTALRRFWNVWLAGATLLVLLLGSHEAAPVLGILMSAILLIFRRCRPYRHLTSGQRAQVFVLGAVALGLLLFGWHFPRLEQPTWAQAFGRNLVSYALGSLRIFWIVSLLAIFVRMRLHHMHLKPKLAVSALLIALVPLVLVLVLAGLTILGALGGSRAVRGQAMLQAWAEQLDHGMRLEPLPFSRHFEADLSEGVRVLAGTPPDWLADLRREWLAPRAAAGDSAGGSLDGAMTGDGARAAERGQPGDAQNGEAGDTERGDRTRRSALPEATSAGAGVPGAVRSREGIEAALREQAASGMIRVEPEQEEDLAGAWAPQDTTAYFRAGGEIWLLRLTGTAAGALHAEGYGLDSTALGYLARLLHCDTGIFSSNRLTVTTDDAAADEANRADTTRTRIDIRGRRESAAKPAATEAGFWNSEIRIGAALLTVIRLHAGGFTTDNVILYLSASLHDLVQDFTLKEYRLNQVLVFGLIVLAVFFLFMEAVALYFGIRIATGITGAVAELHKGTVRLAAGDLDTHIEVPNEDELGELAEAFNDMTGAVKRGREEAVARERLERELETARAIQQRLLPHGSPVVRGFEVLGTSVPSLQVGGDYFDFLDQGEGRLGIAIGDVSGKGMPAALLMSNLQASLQGQVIHPSTVSEIVQRVNDLLVRSTDSQMFATFFYGVLDRNTATFTCTNAGHNPPILCRADGSIELLKRGGLLIGMLPGMKYEQETVVLNPGDVIVLYTDGISEAEGMEAAPAAAVGAAAGAARTAGAHTDGGDAALGRGGGDGERGGEGSSEDAGNMFGEERLMELVRRNARLSAAGIREAVLSAVAAHAAGVPQSDDITVVVIKRQLPGPDVAVHHSGP
jgi:serine phosphatase RsbU (regulator of sigma subunit)